MSNDFSNDGPPDYIKVVKDAYFSAQPKRLSSLRRPVNRPFPVVISVVRNERDRLPDFFRHYREAGIERFSILDNGSSDGTLEFLIDQPDADVFQLDAPFHWPQKQGWIHLLITLAGRSEKVWYLYADADEHVVFDGMPGKSLHDLCAEMDRIGVSRVRGMLVDMYAPGPLLRSRFDGGRLDAAYPLFDGDGYVEARYPQIISRKGGPRRRVFGHVEKDFNPEMTKYPLFRLVDNAIFANPHHIYPYEANFLSPCYLGILHFKFLPNVVEKIEDAIARKAYWNESIEYRCYKAVLDIDPDLDLIYDKTRKYSSPKDLLEAGHILPIDWGLSAPSRSPSA